MEKMKRVEQLWDYFATPVSRLRHVMGLPWRERNSKLKRAFLGRTEAFLGRLVFWMAGYWLNRRNFKFRVEHRPDFHTYLNGVPDYKQLYEGWVFNNRSNNSGDLTRFYTIYLNVNQVLADRVPGDFVELGVYRGNSAMLLVALARQQRRHVYLFDTFTGFDKRDLRGVDAVCPVLFADGSLDAVRNLVGTDGVTYVPGFFPDSISRIKPPEQIAVAHLDCDLYEPIKAGLEWFYPRLSPGGILLLHDYSSGHWPGAKRAVDDFFESLPEKPILAADKSGTALIRRLTCEC